MSFDSDDNNRFIAAMTSALVECVALKVKITPRALARISNYPIRDINENLYEIGRIMDTLSID